MRKKEETVGFDVDRQELRVGDLCRDVRDGEICLVLSAHHRRVALWLLTSRGINWEYAEDMELIS